MIRLAFQLSATCKFNVYFIRNCDCRAGLNNPNHTLADSQCHSFSWPSGHAPRGPFQIIQLLRWRFIRKAKLRDTVECKLQWLFPVLFRNDVNELVKRLKILLSTIWCSYQVLFLQKKSVIVWLLKLARKIVILSKGI